MYDLILETGMRDELTIDIGNPTENWRRRCRAPPYPNYPFKNLDTLFVSLDYRSSVLGYSPAYHFTISATPEYHPVPGSTILTYYRAFMFTGLPILPF